MSVEGRRDALPWESKSHCMHDVVQAFSELEESTQREQKPFPDLRIELTKLDHFDSIRLRVEPVNNFVGCTGVVLNNKYGRTVQIEDDLGWVTEGDTM
jgi:hypothetical protein